MECSVLSRLTSASAFRWGSRYRVSWNTWWSCGMVHNQVSSPDYLRTCIEQAEDSTRNRMEHRFRNTTRRLCGLLEIDPSPMRSTRGIDPDLMPNLQDWALVFWYLDHYSMQSIVQYSTWDKVKIIWSRCDGPGKWMGSTQVKLSSNWCYRKLGTSRDCIDRTMSNLLRIRDSSSSTILSVRSSRIPNNGVLYCDPKPLMCFSSISHVMSLSAWHMLGQ